MTYTETYKIKVTTYIRIKYDDGARDGILIENEKDSDYVKVFFPVEMTIEVITRDMIYKAGKMMEINFNNSGLWE